VAMRPKPRLPGISTQNKNVDLAKAVAKKIRLFMLQNIPKNAN